IARAISRYINETHERPDSALYTTLIQNDDPRVRLNLIRFRMLNRNVQSGDEASFKQYTEDAIKSLVGGRTGEKKSKSGTTVSAVLDTIALAPPQSGDYIMKFAGIFAEIARSNGVRFSYRIQSAEPRDYQVIAFTDGLHSVQIDPIAYLRI